MWDSNTLKKRHRKRQRNQFMTQIKTTLFLFPIKYSSTSVSRFIWNRQSPEWNKQIIFILGKWFNFKQILVLVLGNFRRISIFYFYTAVLISYSISLIPNLHPGIPRGQNQNFSAVPTWGNIISSHQRICMICDVLYRGWSHEILVKFSHLAPFLVIFDRYFDKFHES